MRFHIFILCVVITFTSYGCAYLETTKLSDPPTGVPWIEAKVYDVYIMSDDGKQTEYFGRHALLDRVNEYTDNDRNRWQSNYKGYPFTDATFKMEMHPDSGTPKTISLDRKVDVAASSQSVQTVIGLPDAIKKAKDEEQK